jgi:lysophospholipase L1-like esterase
MNRRSLLCFSTLLLIASASTSEAADHPFKGVKRVVFLGDSITYAGHYIEYIEAILRLRDPSFQTEFIDIGLPSETVSGLSEPGHAGGSFPRPDLHERLERVLKASKPDLIVVCYGMNDGIYYPFGEDRFAKYREGIEYVRERANAHSSKVLHITPPVFDPTPIKSRTLPAGLAEYRQPYEGYDDVLTRYSAWLVSKKGDGWQVIDTHTPMKKFLDDKRKSDPKYVLAGDGVHLNETGHWLIAQEVLAELGIPSDQVGQKVIEAHPKGREALKLIQQKQRIVKDAWLNSTGHKRPGMAKGVSIDEATQQAASINEKLGKLLSIVK